MGLFVNSGTEKSAFSIAEVAVWPRGLTSEEMRSVSDHLQVSKPVNISLVTVGTTVSFYASSRCWRVTFGSEALQGANHRACNSWSQENHIDPIRILHMACSSSQVGPIAAQNLEIAQVRSLFMV